MSRRRKAKRKHHNGQQATKAAWKFEKRDTTTVYTLVPVDSFPPIVRDALRQMWRYPAVRTTTPIMVGAACAWLSLWRGVRSERVTVKANGELHLWPMREPGAIERVWTIAADDVAVIELDERASELPIVYLVIPFREYDAQPDDMRYHFSPERHAEQATLDALMFKTRASSSHRAPYLLPPADTDREPMSLADYYNRLGD